jgi:3-oxoacyl-(acyl-carrier-protein) synthase
LSAGECTIAFQLTGPSLAAGASPAAAIEALAIAHDLVAAGDADHAVVVAVDDVGDTVRAVFSAAELAVPRHGAAAIVLGFDPEGSGVDWASIRSALEAARRSGGGVSGSDPGWPSLLGLLGGL